MKACCGLRTVLAGRAEGTGAPEGLTFRSGGQEHCGLPESVIEREEDGRVGKADVPFGCAEALRFLSVFFRGVPRSQKCHYSESGQTRKRTFYAGRRAIRRNSIAYAAGLW